MDDFLDFLSFLMAGVASLAALAVAAFVIFTGFSLVLDGPTCRARGAALGLETQWGYWTGCLVTISGQTLPMSEVIPIERDGKIVFVPKQYLRPSTDQRQE